MRYMFYRWSRSDPRIRKINRAKPEMIHDAHIFGCFIANLFMPKDEPAGREGPFCFPSRDMAVRYREYCDADPYHPDMRLFELSVEAPVSLFAHSIYGWMSICGIVNWLLHGKCKERMINAGGVTAGLRRYWEIRVSVEEAAGKIAGPWEVMIRPEWIVSCREVPISELEELRTA